MTTDTVKAEDSKIEVFNQPTDDALGNQTITAPPEGAAPAPQATEPTPEYTDGRAAIAARFKKHRVDKEPGIEAHGDYTDPTQTYGQVAAPEPLAPPVQEQQPEPQKRKVKIRGEERELTDDELIAAAQKGLAGDSYIEEARQILEAAKRVQASPQHPEAPKPAPLATEQDEPQDGQHPADPLADIVEQIQYGDPKEAAAKLSTTIAEAVDKGITQRTVSDRVQQDIRNDLNAHDEFVKRNPDLASDPIAHSIIRDQLLNGYREDLRKIGVPDDNIPTDPTQLANHHRHYKLQGQPVRTVATLLDVAANTVKAWRGPARQDQPSPQPQPSTRVEVQLDRNDRRMAIPHQPSRANVQPSMTPAPQQGQNSRSAAVLAAQRARGQAG